MKRTATLAGLLALTFASFALAQTPTQGPPPPNDDLEPGVDTSAAAPDPAPVTERTPPPRSPAAPAATPATQPADATPSRQPANNPAPAASARRSGARDRLDLDATQITGNRELPKVLYIVPWRNAELGDLVGRPVNSLLDEVLEPVDRDVFRRQNRYFEALQPNQAGATGGGSAPANEPEK